MLYYFYGIVFYILCFRKGIHDESTINCFKYYLKAVFKKECKNKEYQLVDFKMQPTEERDVYMVTSKYDNGDILKFFCVLYANGGFKLYNEEDWDILGESAN